jgi:transcriptional regulator with XRE-family HTH domain
MSKLKRNDWGYRLSDIRKKKGLTQYELADKAGIPRSNISAWESSAYPPLENIERICNILDVPLSHFFTPENIVIPDLTPEEAEYFNLFKSVPDKIQAMMIEATANIVEAWKYGLQKIS